MEFGLWRLTDSGPGRVAVAKMPAEDELEELVMRDPAVLGESLLIIGRQVHTAHGGRIDLLGLDETARLHVLELKRDQTPRDVVAQTLDYTSWASALGHADLTEVYSHYAVKYQLPEVSLEAAFEDAFGVPLPDQVNATHQMTVMASAPDSATERIVRFLAETYGVAINMVYFRYFEDEGRRYLARTWLLPEGVVAEESGGSRGRAGKSEAWNGQDYYAAFGLGEDNRSWDDARQYGFFSAGGGKRYTRPVRNLSVGQRLWVAVPGRGYVGVGIVDGPAVPMAEAVLEVDGVPHQVSQLPLRGHYKHLAETGDDSEWLVPMRWLKTVALEQAVWHKGMYANQNIVTRLARASTLAQLMQSPLGLPDE
jgi:hypothetical protein